MTNNKFKSQEHHERTQELRRAMESLPPKEHAEFQDTATNYALSWLSVAFEEDDFDPPPVALLQLLESHLAWIQDGAGQ